MAKQKLKRSAITGQFLAPPAVRADLKTFRSVVAGLKKDPARLREVTVMAGISTPGGKLKKAYKGS